MKPYGLDQLVGTHNCNNSLCSYPLLRFDYRRSIRLRMWPKSAVREDKQHTHWMSLQDWIRRKRAALHRYKQDSGTVLNRNLGRGVRSTERNSDPVQDTKYVNFATLSKRKRESAVISYPVQDWTKQTVFNEAHEISENYVIEGGEKEKICWEDPV